MAFLCFKHTKYLIRRIFHSDARRIKIKRISLDYFLKTKLLRTQVDWSISVSRVLDSPVWKSKQTEFCLFINSIQLEQLKFSSWKVQVNRCCWIIMASPLNRSLCHNVCFPRHLRDLRHSSWDLPSYWIAKQDVWNSQGARFSESSSSKSIFKL